MILFQTTGKEPACCTFHEGSPGQRGSNYLVHVLLTAEAKTYQKGKKTQALPLRSRLGASTLSISPIFHCPKHQIWRIFANVPEKSEFLASTASLVLGNFGALNLCLTDMSVKWQSETRAVIFRCWGKRNQESFKTQMLGSLPVSILGDLSWDLRICVSNKSRW